MRADTTGPQRGPIPTFQGAGYDWHLGESTNGIRGFPAEPRVDFNSRDSIIAWLTWNDHNGCYADADCDAEGLDRLTLATARELIVDACEQSTGQPMLWPAMDPIP